MPDNKTVTFDASQLITIATKAREDAMEVFRDSGNYALDAIEYMFALITNAAPTPAAQSAGQEAVAWADISTAPWSDDLIWVRKGDSIDGPKRIETDDYDRYELWAPCEPPPDAAPVNGGEREAALEEAARLIESTNETVTIEGAGDTIRHLTPRKANDAHNLTGRTWAAAIRALKSQRAADAQQVGADVMERRTGHEADALVFAIMEEVRKPITAANAYGLKAKANIRAILVDALNRAALASPAKVVGDDQHPDDAAVDRFSVAMKTKLAKKRAQGRGGWDDERVCSPDDLARMLVDHVRKGDPVDVGNFAMMLFNRPDAGAALCRAALSAEAAKLGGDERELLSRAIDCLEILNKRPSPLCRDCADNFGTCPHTGLACNITDLIKKARAALSADGEDERERFVRWYTRGTGKPISTNDRDAETAWDAWRAALSADGEVEPEHTAIYLSKRLVGHDGEASFIQAHINQAVSKAVEALSVDSGEADMIWPANDTEQFYHTIDDGVDGQIRESGARAGEILEFECAKRLPNVRVRIISAEISEAREVIEWEIVGDAAIAANHAPKGE